MYVAWNGIAMAYILEVNLSFLQFKKFALFFIPRKRIQFQDFSLEDHTLICLKVFIDL